MPKKDLFEYAVIRVVPRVEREEFLNAGVIVYCAPQQFLGMKYCISPERIRALCAEADIKEIRAQLENFERICNGKAMASPIARLPLPGRFRWLTATRSTIIQCSMVHPGICDEAAATLEKIFRQQVACD
ncbi:MAG: DUF3037 domain-containing protein [Sphingobacteriales bacterium]|nr:DUF3037 domain-containing protein [Sphingobacteriales bacterium]